MIFNLFTVCSSCYSRSLSVCWWRNKRKFSVCKRTKRIKRTKWTCHLHCTIGGANSDEIFLFPCRNTSSTELKKGFLLLGWQNTLSALKINSTPMMTNFPSPLWENGCRHQCRNFIGKYQSTSRNFSTSPPQPPPG